MECEWGGCFVMRKVGGDGGEGYKERKDRGGGV